MDEEKYQKELFEFEKPKRAFPRLSDFFPKADFERNIALTLTLDRVVFIAIGITMVMVVVYALGVEAGKSRSSEYGRQKVATTILPAANVLQGREIAPDQAAASTIVSTAQVVPAPTGARRGTAVGSINKPYTIIVAAFSSRDSAVQEVGRLQKQGFAAAMQKSDRYILVSVGAYSDKYSAEVQKDLQKLRRLY